MPSLVRLNFRVEYTPLYIHISLFRFRGCYWHHFRQLLERRGLLDRHRIVRHLHENKKYKRGRQQRSLRNLLSDLRNTRNSPRKLVKHRKCWDKEDECEEQDDDSAEEGDSEVERTTVRCRRMILKKTKMTLETTRIRKNQERIIKRRN